MDVYKITLKGFDGSTDKTDHLILWIASDKKPSITEGSQVKSIRLINSLVPDAPGVDLVIGDPPMFTNYYYCDSCLHRWNDTWSCMCNDRCPECNREVEPYKSEEVQDGRKTEEGND